MGAPTRHGRRQRAPSCWLARLTPDQMGVHWRTGGASRPAAAPATPTRRARPCRGRPRRTRSKQSRCTGFVYTARHRRLHHSTAARRVRWHDRQWDDVLVAHLWLLGLRFRPPWSVCIPPLLHDAGSGVCWATDAPTARRRSVTGGPNSLRLAPDPRGDTCNGAR